ncbi:MAG: hypothetical protein R2764_25650 [Bacteroidales bacterium]
MKRRFLMLSILSGIIFVIVGCDLLENSPDEENEETDEARRENMYIDINTGSGQGLKFLSFNTNTGNLVISGMREFADTTNFSAEYNSEDNNAEINVTLTFRGRSSLEWFNEMKDEYQFFANPPAYLVELKVSGSVKDSILLEIDNKELSYVKAKSISFNRSGFRRFAIISADNSEDMRYNGRLFTGYFNEQFYNLVENFKTYGKNVSFIRKSYVLGETKDVLNRYISYHQDNQDSIKNTQRSFNDLTGEGIDFILKGDFKVNLTYFYDFIDSHYLTYYGITVNDEIVIDYPLKLYDGD